jgi:hypothetical protein
VARLFLCPCMHCMTFDNDPHVSFPGRTVFVRMHPIILRFRQGTNRHLPPSHSQIPPKHKQIPCHADAIPPQPDLAPVHLVPRYCDLFYRYGRGDEGSEEEELDIK